MGEWRIRGSREANLVVLFGDDGDIATFKTGKKPAGLQYDKAKARAQLCSTAPEMLKALEELFEHCAIIHKHWGDNCNQREADAAIAKSRAAIAKATTYGR